MNKNKMKYKLKKATRKVAKLGKKLKQKIYETLTAFFFETIELVLKLISATIALIFLALVVLPILEKFGVFEKMSFLEPLLEYIKIILEKLL